MLEPLRPEVHAWYRRACGAEQEGKKGERLRRRAERHTQRVKGPRPSTLQPGAKGDVEYFGGNPLNWRAFGCHPSRFHAYPAWPPPRGEVFSEPSVRPELGSVENSLRWDWALENSG